MQGINYKQAYADGIINWAKDLRKKHTTKQQKRRGGSGGI